MEFTEAASNMHDLTRHAYSGLTTLCHVNPSSFSMQLWLPWYALRISAAAAMDTSQADCTHALWVLLTSHSLSLSLSLSLSPVQPAWLVICCRQCCWLHAEQILAGAVSTSSTRMPPQRKKARLTTHEALEHCLCRAYCALTGTVTHLPHCAEVQYLICLQAS